MGPPGSKSACAMPLDSIRNQVGELACTIVQEQKKTAGASTDGLIPSRFAWDTLPLAKPMSRLELGTLHAGLLSLSSCGTDRLQQSFTDLGGDLLPIDDVFLHHRQLALIRGT